MYQTIEFSRLAALAPFSNKFQLERVIVDAAKRLELQIRIDHRTSSLSFGTDLGLAQKEDVPEGPYLQSMPSEKIRNQLINMAQALHSAVNIVQPESRKVVSQTYTKFLPQLILCVHKSKTHLLALGF